jgi:hypothetical protein
LCKAPSANPAAYADVLIAIDWSVFGDLSAFSITQFRVPFSQLSCGQKAGLIHSQTDVGFKTELGAGSLLISAEHYALAL